MIGIYKIANKINGNIYIGMSVNIEKRWKDHIYRSKNFNKEFDKPLYRAFRKYGLDNFSFEVIEECAPNELSEKEIYWIRYYNSYEKGYNCTRGGQDAPVKEGEYHPNHKLTENDVRYIRELWASKTISTREMYYEFQNRIGKTGFKKIYTWQTWKKILPELNTQENRDWHRHNKESYANKLASNPNAVLTDKDYINIIQRYKNGDSLKEIYSDYKQFYASYQSFYASNHPRCIK